MREIPDSQPSPSKMGPEGNVNDNFRDVDLRGQLKWEERALADIIKEIDVIIEELKIKPEERKRIESYIRLKEIFETKIIFGKIGQRHKMPSPEIRTQNLTGAEEIRSRLMTDALVLKEMIGEIGEFIEDIGNKKELAGALGRVLEEMKNNEIEIRQALEKI